MSDSRRSCYFDVINNLLVILIQLKSSHYMSHQSAILGGGLESYKEGLEVDPELVLQESDIDEESTLLSTTIPYFFDRGTWEKWTLKSGLIVSEKLKSVASTEGHPLR